MKKIATTDDGTTLQAPNDLVLGPDGRLHLTDPAEASDPGNPREENRLFAIDDSGGEMLIELPPSYTNGLAFNPDGNLVWVETYGRFGCLLECGGRLWRVPTDAVRNPQTPGSIRVS